MKYEAEDDGDLQVFKENDEDIDNESVPEGNLTKEEEPTEISANGIVYSRHPPADCRHARNIIDYEHRPCNLAHVTSELEALPLFFPEVLHVILRHTNQKCHDVSRQCHQKIPPFSYEEF